MQPQMIQTVSQTDRNYKGTIQSLLLNENGKKEWTQLRRRDSSEQHVLFGIHRTHVLQHQSQTNRKLYAAKRNKRFKHARLNRRCLFGKNKMHLKTHARNWNEETQTHQQSNVCLKSSILTSNAISILLGGWKVTTTFQEYRKVQSHTKALPK